MWYMSVLVIFEVLCSKERICFNCRVIFCLVLIDVYSIELVIYFGFFGDCFVFFVELCD